MRGTCYMEYAMESDGMHYEGNCIRPPSEAYSILLQVTLGCSHNKCAFCGTYKDKRFQIKDDKTILSDILFASQYTCGLCNGVASCMSHCNRILRR